MNHLTVLFPAVGGEATVAAIKSLRVDWPGPERLTIIGCDVDGDKKAFARADRFLISPRRDNPEYIRFLLDLCREAKVDLLWPNPIEEQLLLLRHREVFESKGVRMLLPPAEGLETLSDKKKTYQFAASLDLRVPRWKAVSNWDQLSNAAREFGYPENPVVFRRTFGKGAIGLRILAEGSPGGVDIFHKPADGKVMSLDALQPLIQDLGDWPPCLVCEHVGGDEFDVDCFCSQDGLETAVPRRSYALWGGTSLRAETVDRPDLVAICERLLKGLGWRYICSVTFREDRQKQPVILEVNCRMPSSSI